MASIGAPSLARILGEWHTSGPGYLALAEAIRVATRDGRLPLGAALPSERGLAEILNVSRTTITAAYTELRESGHLQSRPGARSVLTVPAAAPRAAEPLAGYDIGLNIAAPSAPERILAASYAAALEHLPRFLSSSGISLYGLDELRATVAARYTERGVPTSADEILITSGAQQALRIVAEAMVPRGAAVIVEQPVHTGSIAGLANSGIRMTGFPVAPGDDGWDLDYLEHLFRSTAPALFFTVPDHQNPVGHTASAASRARLLELAARYRVIVLADETTSELTFTGAPPPPIAQFATTPRARQHLITVGSASKTVWAGLRVGWVRAPASVIARLATHRYSIDISSALIEQLAANHALERLGEFLPQRRDALRSNSMHAASAISAAIPGTTVAPITGGLVLWCALPPDGPGSTALAAAAQARGVRIIPGPSFGIAGAQFERFLRLPFTLPPETLRSAVEIIGAAYATLGPDAKAARGFSPAAVV